MFEDVRDEERQQRYALEEAQAAMNHRIEELTQALASRDYEAEEEPPWPDEAAHPRTADDGLLDDLLSGTPSFAGGLPDPLYIGGTSGTASVLPGVSVPRFGTA
eukprot:3121134-Prorocentrum_lima.AAC.1